MIDVRMINHSGIGTYIKNIIPSLVDDYELTLIGDREKITFHQWAANVNVIDCTVPIYSIKEQIYLPSIIPTCELFLSPHYNIPRLPIKSKRRAVIIYDVNHLVYRDRLSILQKFYAQAMINAAIRQSDKVITISKFSEKEIKKYTKLADKNTNILYPCINRNASDKKSLIKILKDARARYKFPENYLLYVGSIKPHKNFKNLLKAYKLLRKKDSKQKLVVVGISERELKQDYEILDFIKNNEELTAGIFYPGYIEDNDMNMIYSGATCLVFPSLYEGFGLPPLEAMSNGCPVTVSNAASIPEACGDAALYFDPEDYKSIFNSIESMLDDAKLRHDLVEKGYRNLSRFSPENFTSQLHSIIRDTIGN